MKYLLAALLFASTVHAACSDEPAAGVDWTSCVFPDGKNLSGLDLQLAVMPGVWLRFANLTGTNLANAQLMGANFTGANLTGANLTAALMHDANFYAANFENAKLTGAAMIRTNIISANLKDAKLYRTTWIDGSKVCAPESVGACQ